jgi:hypothetical protein
MADSVQIKVTGLQELETKLLQMGQELAAKNIVPAAYSENKKVVDAAKSNIVSGGLVDTGLLHNSITRKKIIYGKDGKVVIITGINKSVKGVDKKGRPRVPWRYANVLEPKFHFMEKAQESTKDAVVNGFVSNLEKRIKKFLKKQ